MSITVLLNLANGRTIEGMTMITRRAPTPTPERNLAWRAACLAYRERRHAGALDHEAHLAAVAALQAEWPGLTWKEASDAEAVMGFHPSP